MRIRTNGNSKPPSPSVDTVNPLPSIAFATKTKTKFKIMLEQIEKDRNLSLKERFDIFLSETSFTALIKICKAGTIIKQIIWLVTVLAMLTWLCVQCYWLFEKYFQYPYEVKIELVADPEMEFPSVTICNRNPLRKSQISRSPFMSSKDLFDMRTDSSLYDAAVGMMKNESDTQHWRWDDGDSSDEDMQEMTAMRNLSFNVWSALDNEQTAKDFYKATDQEMEATFAYARIAATIEQSELKLYGHQIEDFLASCRFMGKQCSPANFTYVHNVKYGNCFTFNAFNNSMPALTTTYSGPLMGLAMELNVQQSEYISALAPDAGVRVLVHTRGTFPAPEDDGFSVPVGFVTSVGLQVTEITRLEPPHSTCSDKGKIENLYETRYGVSYEKSTCIKTCKQNIWKEKCGCAIPLYELPANTSVCDCKDEESETCLWKQSVMMRECDTICPAPCFEKKYEPLISMATFPSKDYEHYLDYKLMHTSLDFMGGPDHEKADSDDNVAKIEIYLREMMYEKIEQQKSYESQNLISDVGGQLGLWLGLSAITIGEVFEFFMAVFKAVTANAVRRRHKETTVEALGDRKLSLKDFN